MHGGVTASSPATAPAQVVAMVFFADVEVTRVADPLLLCMTFEAEI